MCISRPFIPVTLFTSCISQRLKIYCALSLSHLSPPPNLNRSPPSFSTFFFKGEIFIWPPTYLSLLCAPLPPLVFLSPLSRGAEAVLPGVAPLFPPPFFYEFFRHPLLVMSHSAVCLQPPPRASVSQQAVKQHSQDPLPPLSITVDLHQAVTMTHFPLFFPTYLTSGTEKKCSVNEQRGKRCINLDFLR